MRPPCSSSPFRAPEGRHHRAKLLGYRDLHPGQLAHSDNILIELLLSCGRAELPLNVQHLVGDELLPEQPDCRSLQVQIRNRKLLDLFSCGRFHNGYLEIAKRNGSKALT